MNKLTILVMVLAAGGMIFGLSKQKAGAMWGRPLAIICALIALGCALASILKGGGAESNRLVDIDRRLQEVCGEKLGLHLAEAHAGAKAIILVEPTASGATPTPSPLLDGLRKGMGTAITIVEEVAPEVPGGAQAATMNEAQPMPDAAGGGQAGAAALPPLEFWFTSKIVDGIINDYKGKCDMVITTIGLPSDVRNMKFWTMKERPKLVLAKGSVYDLRKAIEGEAVVAAIAFNPTPTEFDRVPKDLDEAFDLRFILVTPENQSSVASAHTGLFRN